MEETCVANEPKKKAIMHSRHYNQPFIFVRIPQKKKERTFEQEIDFQISRLPSIESLPAILSNIVKAKKQDKTCKENPSETLQNPDFIPSLLDPLGQRDTTIIDIPIHA